jgi:hypothetical protein
MKQYFTTLALVVALAGSALAQKPQATLGAGKGGANFRKPFEQTAGTVRTLSADTVYALTGWYFVDSTAVIVIPAGTLILGDSASAGTLIVRRGGKIVATGTQAEPIVFTSAKPAGQRRPGDWGGVIILGKAPTNQPSTKQIEGGFGTAADNNAAYGGSNADDSSGVLRYARIEFAGIAFSQDNEINGLTFGGVGRKTVVDHVQVSFANDDDFEFFGGTVDARYLVSWRSLDDDFDTDFGYSGRIQFAVVKRDPQIFDASTSGSSNGFESDNESTAPYTATPRTSARFSNVTILGPAADSAAANALNAKWQYVAMLRRSTELSIYNSLLTGYRLGINLRDTLTQDAALNNRLEIRSTSLAVPREVVRTSSSPTTGVPPGFTVATWFTNGGNTGGTSRQAGDLGFGAAAFSLDNGFNPVPPAGSEAATGGTSFAGRLQGDSWFTQVAYRGAFEPGVSMANQWTAGWTNFDPQNVQYVTSVEPVTDAVPSGFSLQQNYPNPFNPATQIRFAVQREGFVSLKVYNTLGQEVATLVSQVVVPGTYESTFDAARFSSGTYVYRLSANGITMTRKMMFVK